MCGFEPRQRQAQFLLPMVVHRRANGFAALRGVERLAKSCDITQAVGSPVVLRADRREDLKRHAHSRHRAATVLSRARHADRDALARRGAASGGAQVDVLTYHVGEDPKLPGVRVFRAPAVPFVRDVPIGFSVRKVLCDLALLWRLLHV